MAIRKAGPNSKRFPVVLGTAFSVTFAAGLVMLIGAFSWGDPLTVAQQQALDIVSNVFLIGSGSIIALLGTGNPG